MSALSVQDIITRVQRTFGDESGAQITPEDIIRWINDAQEEIVEANETLMQTTSSTDVVAGQAEYDYPSDLSIFRSMKYNGYRLRYMSFNEFNEYLDGYNSPVGVFGPGTPEVLMVWQNKITVFPTPSINLTNGFTIYYVRHPVAVVTTADTPEVPTQYHKAIVDYCLKQAYELDEDTAKQQVKDAAFQAKMMQQNNRNSRIEEYYPRITTLPEDETYGSYGVWGGF